MDINISATIQTPAKPVYTPFGPTTAPATSQDVTVVLHIDAATQSELASLLVPPAPDAHLTAAALAAQYTPAELTAALTAALSGGGK